MVDSLFGADGGRDFWTFEKRAFQLGYVHIAGIDEAGRGALAGPVVAAAVILPEGLEIEGIDDSKKLSPSKREVLFDAIVSKSLAVGIGLADSTVIDQINILQATLLAMKKAVLELAIEPDHIFVDGNCTLPIGIPQRAIVRGDSSSISIAAASIVAKVTRDRLMVEYDEIYPGYGFAGHKGYGCASHLASITALGPCQIHRKTFGGVKEHICDSKMTLFAEARP